MRKRSSDDSRRCRSCGADILWVVNEASGRRMPLDAHPVETGQFAKSHVSQSGDKVVRHVPEPLRANYPGKLYETHFATCPNADSHRRG